MKNEKAERISIGLDVDGIEGAGLVNIALITSEHRLFYKTTPAHARVLADQLRRFADDAESVKGGVLYPKEGVEMSFAT